MSSSLSCFHCGLPVPSGLDIKVEIDGVERAMCCYGCQAVAQTIVDSGMTEFYRYRTENAERPAEIVPEFLDQLHIYDNPSVQQQFIKGSGEIQEVSLLLEGIVCAACVWLNEKTIGELDGVIETDINYATHRARIRWDDSRIQLSEILEAISRIGYRAHPYDPDTNQHIYAKEKKQQLRRLGVAGAIGMQIMILAVAMYTGEWWGIEDGHLALFRWTSLLLTIPLLLFASDIFFRNAWRDLSNRRVGMDVPVSLGMGLAFIASVNHTVTGIGSVYFDSIAMFTLFLLTARYFEMSTRKRSAESIESVLNLTPATATLLEDGRERIVAVAELVVGDRVRVKPGETIPIDGRIIEGMTAVDESLISGESHPVLKHTGDEVIGGSINTDDSFIIEVTRVGEDTVIASIHRMIETAQQSRPEISRLADAIAGRFVLAVLMITSLVAIYWYTAGSAQWLEYSIATLVITCPCALSLATPSALTAASGAFARLGLLPLNNSAIETYANATDFVFDKTGTLTHGEPEISSLTTCSSTSEQDCIDLAAALEEGSEHPIARAFIERRKTVVQAEDVRNIPGQGRSGVIDDEHWHLGSVNHIQQRCSFDLDDIPDAEDGSTTILLANDSGLIARFDLKDKLREEAPQLIEHLHRLLRKTHLVSGDQASSVRTVADETGIKHSSSCALPQNKLDYVRELQSKQRIVVMIGDGINDAPVLSGADIAIAMGSGSDIASSNADMVLLSSNIDSIAKGYLLAKRTLDIIRQNMIWAIGYNLLAVPAAASGLVQPWLAAIGMSVSSIIVVLNASRLNR